MIVIILIFCLSLFVNSLEIPNKLTRIAFGSCYGKDNLKSDIFDNILKTKPDLWVWIGDAA
jgi:hypothetical protein